MCGASVVGCRGRGERDVSHHITYIPTYSTYIPVSSFLAREPKKMQDLKESGVVGWEELGSLG